VPDIATFSFSVVSSKSTVAAGQTEATAKINAVTDYLKAQGIDAKDIQTSDYSVYRSTTTKALRARQAPARASPTASGQARLLRGYERAPDHDH